MVSLTVEASNGVCSIACFENNVSVIEWGEFIEEFLPNERLIFNIRLVDDYREVEIISSGEYKKIEERICENW